MLNKNSAGMSLGLFMVAVHAVWAIIVWMGSAQKFWSWMMSLHFMKMNVSTTAFDLGTAVMLLVVTFVGGYLFGWVFAWIWNKYRK